MRAFDTEVADDDDADEIISNNLNMADANGKRRKTACSHDATIKKDPLKELIDEPQGGWSKCKRVVLDAQLKLRGILNFANRKKPEQVDMLKMRTASKLSRIARCVRKLLEYVQSTLCLLQPCTIYLHRC